MKKRNYNISTTEVCRGCLGEGVTKENFETICPVCGGSGLVEVNKKLEISIVPKNPKPYA